jgi:hypothetical protein
MEVSIEMEVMVAIQLVVMVEDRVLIKDPRNQKSVQRFCFHTNILYW